MTPPNWGHPFPEADPSSLLAAAALRAQRAKPWHRCLSGALSAQCGSCISS